MAALDAAIHAGADKAPASRRKIEQFQMIVLAGGIPPLFSRL